MGRESSFIAGFDKKAGIKNKLMFGVGALATGYTGKKLYDLSEDPEQKLIREAGKKRREQMKIAFSSIDQVKKDIKSYEKHKKRKHVSTALMGLATGAAAIGAAKGNVNIALPGLVGAFTSGFARGKSKKEEAAALSRVKRYYDLRAANHYQEKSAVIGGITELISSLPGLLGSALPTLAHAAAGGAAALGLGAGAAAAAGASVPFLIDMATIPFAAKRVAASTRSHTYVAAKDAMGLPLTASEKGMRALSTIAKAEQMKVDAMKPGLRKSFNEYFKGLYGPWGTGGEIGEAIGTNLKELNKLSPRYSQLSLDAIKDTAGFDRLVDNLKKDKKTYSTAGSVLESTIDEVPGLRRLLNSSGKNWAEYAKRVIDKPSMAIDAAGAVKDTVRGGVRGGKYMLGAAGLAGLGMILGGRRDRHPLAKDELPKKLLSNEMGSRVTPQIAYNYLAPKPGNEAVDPVFVE